MASDYKRSINNDSLHQALLVDALAAQKRFTKKHPSAAEYLSRHGIVPGKLREHAAKVIAGSALASSLLLSMPAMHMTQNMDQAKLAHLQQDKREEFFSRDIKPLVTTDGAPLTSEQEKKISSLIRQYWGIGATAELEGNRLNHSWGYIGAEQHLPRFPGDSVGQQDALPHVGMTPGRGAWGYFAQSRDRLTGELARNEKYYVAVQTLYLPDWKSNLKYLREWYKYRKVAVVNPDNGKVVIAVIADAGPAQWTGKQFGGSPEVMDYLQLKDGKQKKRVVLFFVDDPLGEVPLGPVAYNYAIGKPIAERQ